MPATVNLHKGDCLKVLDTFPADHFDAVVTDPPYHLESIVKRFGGQNATAAKTGRDGAFARSSEKFMGKTWDGGDIAFRPETWAKLVRVLKPGGHLFAFNHATTWHRMAVALEDGGFDFRDTYAWLYGTGLPKNHPTARALEKIGAPPEVVAQYEGWGTTAKPSMEPIALVRKPLSESSIVRQVMATGTGALNLAAAVIPAPDLEAEDGQPATRYPTNVLHDGSAEVRAIFPLDKNGGPSPARFFYYAKANKDDRRGSNHPTVKPQALMQWLVRLVCPKGGRILDPFGGSGSTGWAAHAEGVHADLIEIDPEYQADIARGIADLDRPRVSLTDPAPDALPGQQSLF
jgi:site-specific DNA-methyltransferase (adenine-specific)